MQPEILTAIITIAVLIGVVGIRSATKGRVEITLNDAVIAAISAALVLLVTGKLSKVVVGQEGVTIETAKAAILASADRPIDQQVKPLPVAPLEQATKEGLQKLAVIIREKVQGLDFILSAGGYDPIILRSYLDELVRYDFFRFVVILNPDGTLFGMLDARSLLASLETPDSGLTFQSFVAVLNRGSEADKQFLQSMSGFTPAKAAVTKDADKRQVLDQMEQSGRSWLPVVAQGRLVGIVEQSRLTASMIIDVTDQLRSQK